LVWLSPHHVGKDPRLGPTGHQDPGRWGRVRVVRAARPQDDTEDEEAMPSPLMTESIPLAWICQMCDCAGDGCDGTVCHGLDAD
jgi:hypothetical protein